MTQSATAETEARRMHQSQGHGQTTPFPIFNPTTARRGVQATLSRCREAAEEAALTREIEAYAMQNPRTGKVYLEKFTRAGHENALAWRNVSLRSSRNLLRDEILKCEILRCIGEHPQVPERCKACKCLLATETNPS